MQYDRHYGQTPCHSTGESIEPHLRVDFDRRLKLEFHGSKITSDAGLLAYRELGDALGLTKVAGGLFQDSRTGKNGRHGMAGQFRQSVFGRLGGYDDVNDADRLGRDPAMRPIQVLSGRSKGQVCAARVEVRHHSAKSSRGRVSHRQINPIESGPRPIVTDQGQTRSETPFVLRLSATTGSHLGNPGPIQKWALVSQTSEK